MDQDIERSYEALGGRASMITREQAEKLRSARLFDKTFKYLPTGLELQMITTIIELYDELDRVNKRVDSLETMVTVWSSAFRTQRDSMR